MPAETKTIVCLANSRKMSGRCVAGKELANSRFGEWIRPVSSRPEKELSAYDRHYKGTPQSEPELLNVIEIDFLGKDPHPYQPENYLIDDKIYWGLLRMATYAEALGALDPMQRDLWGMSPDSSYHGMFDRVSIADAPSFNSSLRLIKVDDLRIRVRAEGANFGKMKKKLRGYFTYSRFQYAIMITDPNIENIFFNMAEGTYDIGSSLLCVSLGEPYQGYAYKLIAGVILPP